jgi:uncharacterized protein YkwD
VKIEKIFWLVVFFFAHVNNVAFAVTDIYISPPTFSPYYAGVVRQSVLEEALMEVNYLRLLAGVPGDLTLNDDYTNKAQHGAVLMDANDIMSHYPEKPADMPEDFYELGYAGTSNGNIGYQWASKGNVRIGNDSLIVAIKNWMDDSNSRSNIASVGHRRWILNPRAKQTGFGISSRGGYSVMYVVDGVRGDTYVYDYIPWPVKGEHPLNYFDIEVPWSSTLSASKYAKCGNEVQVKLTRNSDGRIWRFSATQSNGYFNIDDSIYEDCIIFRPDGVDHYNDGESWLVEVTGLKTKEGETTDISYTTTFKNVKPETGNDDSESGDESESGGGCNAWRLSFSFFVLAVAHIFKIGDIKRRFF